MYRIKLIRRAEKDFENLPPKIVGRVRHNIDNLAQNPRPSDCKKIKTVPGYLRIKSGEYRILYEVNDRENLVIINRIRHRSEAYR